MTIAIKENFSIDIYGFAGVAVHQNWAQTGVALMNKMWKEVKSHRLKHKGINIWVYEADNKMFAGVELEAQPPHDSVLERKQIHLNRYVYYKHNGPYDKIGATCAKVLNELNQKGINTCWPYIEIYGHWTEDTSKLETELMWCLDN